MALELVKDSIKVNRVVGKDSTQTVIDNDIIVPDVKPDIARILLLDGDVYVKSAETMQDRLLVNGVVNYKILYLSEDSSQAVRSINNGVNFSYSLDLINARQGMSCSVKCDIEHMDYTLLNGRKVNVKTILNVTGKATEEVEQDIVKDLDGLEGIQVLRENLSLNCYLGEGENEYTVRESMDVPESKPSIREILRSDIRITGKDYKVAEDKVIAKGELSISTLYIGDDEYQSMQMMEHEIPFTQFIDVPGLDEDCECEIDFRVVDSMFNLQEDSDGELRILNGEVTVGAFGSAYRKSDMAVLSDAYGLNTRLELEKQTFEVEDLVFESKSQAVLKETIVTNEGSPEIVELFNVLAKPVLTDYKVMDGKVVVEGVANNNVLYIANDTEQPVYCHVEELPFTHTIEIKEMTPEMDCEIELDIDHCNYSMLSSNEVEVRVAVNVMVKAVRKVRIPVISKVNEYQMDDRQLKGQPGIVIYFTQPGDTIWNISKKYRTTPEDLQRVNGLNEESPVQPGQQIMIFRKAN